MMIAGLDEAGRGSVIGPLVLCGILIDEEFVGSLIDVGIRDSKLLSRRRRIELRDRIIEIVADYLIVEIPPSEIDSAVRIHRLNDLEARYFSIIIDRLKPSKAYIDSPLRDYKRFSDMVSSYCKWRCEVIALCHADRDIPVVSAASILAKVRRDEIIDSYRSVYGEVGSGYPSDTRTIEFLRRSMSEAEAAGIVRRSWRTYASIIHRRGRQTVIDAYRDGKA